MSSSSLTPKQQAMVEMWDRHTAAEFEDKNIQATMATMTPDPFVNHVPVMTGGVGFNEVQHFYSTYFIPGHPPDTQVVPVARTVGEDRIVDELIQQIYPYNRYAVDSSGCATYGQICRSCRHRCCTV